MELMGFATIDNSKSVRSANSKFVRKKDIGVTIEKMQKNEILKFWSYSGIRLMNPRLINPAAYYIQFAWNGIVPILSRYKNFG